MTTVSIVNRVTRVSVNNERREIIITPRLTQVTIKPFGPQGLKGDQGDQGIGVNTDPGDITLLFDNQLI